LTPIVLALMAGKATIIFNNNVITAGLPQQIKANLYYDNLKGILLKDNHWTEEVFKFRYWEAFHLVIVTVPRTHRISITKVCHQLWNTNDQNQKFYGHSSLCHLCCKATETIDHIYSCASPLAQQGRLKAIQPLRVAMEKAYTPRSIIKTLEECLTAKAGEALVPQEAIMAQPLRLMEEQMQIGLGGYVGASLAGDGGSVINHTCLIPRT